MLPQRFVVAKKRGTYVVFHFKDFENMHEHNFVQKEIRFRCVKISIRDKRQQSLQLVGNLHAVTLKLLSVKEKYDICIYGQKEAANSN